MKLNILRFDPHKSFLALPVLWIAVSFLTAISTVISIIILLNESFVLDLSAKGFNNFLNIFKLPLGILALIIPIVALLAANHRSEQTKKQIITNEEQNIFSNYFKHIEEFEKYIDSHINQEFGTKVISKRQCHRTLFPQALSGDLRIDKDISEKVNQSFQLIEKYLRCFEGGHPKTPAETICTIELEMRNIESKMFCRWLPEKPTESKINGLNIYTKDGSLFGFIFEIKIRSKLIKDLMEFDQYFEISESNKNIVDLNHKKTPRTPIAQDGNYVSFNVFQL